MEDLPLFNWTPPECTVLAFPIQRRVGDIRKAAQVIAGAKTNRDADYKWNRALSTLHRRMKQAGLSDDVIEREIRGFRNLVHKECIRIGSRLVPALPDKSPDQHHHGRDGGAA